MRSRIKRITAMILAVVMVLIAAPVMPGSNTVYADTTAKLPVKPHDPLDVYVTITNAGAVEVANESINVKDADSDGSITLDDVFVAAHDKWFEGGAAEGYATEYSEAYQSYGISKFWGVSNGGSYTYYVNNAMAWGLYAPVAEGDHVVAGAMKDAAGYSDKYTYFDSFDYDANGTLTVTLKSATGDYDDNWNPVYGPCTNANITLLPVTKTPADGSYNVVNNGDGTYSLTFYKTGEYKLVASNDDTPLIPAVSDLKVTKAVDKNYKFRARISSQTETNGIGSVTGTVYDNYDADLQFSGTHVNRSNFTLEMWMKNVASLDVDAERYYTRTVETGVTGEDSAMSTIQALFNGFNEESKVVTLVDGETTMTYTIKNEDGMVKAKADSFDNAHDTWYAIVNEENMTVTHSEGEDDSYIVIAKGSWLQAGDKKLEFQSDEDLRIDDIGDIAGVRQAIRDALALNDAEAVETLEIYLEPGTTLAVSSSKVVLEKDAKITVDFGNFDESDLAADLEKLQQAGDAEQLIKDGLKFVEKIVDAMGGETTNVTIDFGHLYPAADEQDEENPNPVWEWAEDGSWATATFTCLNNDEHVEVFDSRKGEVTITPDDENNPSLLTASVTVNGEVYTSTFELDIVVLPYPGTAPHDETTRFTENTDDKDITNDAVDTYTIQGHLVTVTCDMACKIGYYDEAADRYITVKDITKVNDNQYTFKVPDEINEVILVIKGDVDLDGEIILFDTVLARNFDLYYQRTMDMGYDNINLFAADVDDDEDINLFDTVYIRDADLYPDTKPILWVYE